MHINPTPPPDGVEVRSGNPIGLALPRSGRRPTEEEMLKAQRPDLDTAVQSLLKMPLQNFGSKKPREKEGKERKRSSFKYVLEATMTILDISFHLDI